MKVEKLHKLCCRMRTFSVSESSTAVAQQCAGGPLLADVGATYGRPMRLLRGLVAGTALTALAAMPTAGAAGPAAVPDVTVGPLQSGMSAYVDGTYAWTDYAYDDTGANTKAGEPGAA